jgi:acyl-CoA thioesterase FadM
MSKTNDARAPRPEPGPNDFVHRIRVGWADCDPALIVYTGKIPCFALEAIDRWWEHHIGQDWFRLNFDQNIGTPFVHVSIDFRAPVTPRFPLDCGVSLAKLGESSITFIVRGMQNDVRCFEGKFICVFIEAKSFKRISVPSEIRRLITPLLEPASELPNESTTEQHG